MEKKKRYIFNQEVGAFIRDAIRYVIAAGLIGFAVWIFGNWVHGA